MSVEPPPSVSELFARWQQGDVEAGNRIYQRLNRTLDGMIRKRVGAGIGEHTRHEVKQSVFASFLRIVRNGGFELRNTAGVFGYLKFIVRKKALGACRRPDPVETVDREDPTPGPHVEVDQDDALASLLARLQPRTRRIAEWTMRGLSMGEICEKEGCGRHTVRRHLNHVGVVLTNDKE